MALARLKVWIAGDVLTAADQNGEFNNILNNPISLISPTTGAINFNLTAHTNLVPSAISASSATAGNALIASTAATPLSIWGTPSSPIAALSGLTSGQLIIGASSGAGTALGIGSTGQVLSVTSSNTNPVWGVIPISGGLTSGVLSTGAIFYVSSSGVLTPLVIGTSGQVLTVTSSLSAPGWAAAAAAASAAGVITSQLSLTEEFLTIGPSGTAITSGASFSAFTMGFIDDNATLLSTIQSSQGGKLLVASSNVTGGRLSLSNTNSTTPSSVPRLFLSTWNPQLAIFLAFESSSTGSSRFGFLSTTITTGDPKDGIFFRTSAGNGSTFRAVARVNNVETILVTTAVQTSSGNSQLFQVNISSSGTLATVLTNGVSAGTFTTAQFPAASTGMIVGFSFETTGDKLVAIDAIQFIHDRVLIV